MDPTRVLITSDPCPFGLPVIFTAAQMFLLHAGSTSEEESPRNFPRYIGSYKLLEPRQGEPRLPNKDY